MADDLDNIFTRPTEPKSSVELLKWAFFEPLLVEQYSDRLSRLQAVIALLKVYPLIIFLVGAIYLFISVVIVFLELPLLFPSIFKDELSTLFLSQHTFIDRYLLFINEGVLKLAFGLALGLALGLASGLASGLALGLASGLALGLAFYIGYFRLFLYPFYNLFKLSFTSSPYHLDAVIWLPLWRAKQRFCDLALETPSLAQQFVYFLRGYRPLQTKLADSISHAANAGFWLQAPLAIENTLDAPWIENKKLQPSDKWLKQLAATKQQLIGYHHQSQINLKKDQFLIFLKALENLKDQTLVENRGWRDYYLQAIEKWQQAGKDELTQLELQIKTLEPITANVYIAGDPLMPNAHQAVFFGRQDLQEKFARKVLSAQQMPMFLIQGQRRTGKTSLLNFLSPLLGSGFQVVYQDLQDGRVNSINAWMNDLHQRISQQLDIPFQAWDKHEDWQASWQLMQDWLSDVTKEQPYKLILAFDEYEKLHDLLQKDPEQAGHLLGAMRSFSQHQNQVVFLFVGSALFSELKAPNWNEYFVQAQRFRVDYLTQVDSIRLITEPVKLVYPAEVSQRMFDLTQGHPALLQELCEKMVDIANTKGKKDMVQTDLDHAVKELVHDRGNATLSVFWGQFCVQDECKETVRQILKQQEITDEKQCFRLEEHQFIVETHGQWTIRVPLFEQWLHRFSERDW